MVHWITRQTDLAGFLASALEGIGLDTEFMRTNTFAPRLALIQLRVGDETALVDPTAALDPQPLANVLGDSARVVVMHSASEDLEALATWSCSIARLFDTQIAASFSGLGVGLGYRALVLRLAGVELPKSETRSDWLHRPLTPAQLDYAAQDVQYLQVLQAALSERLAQRGYSTWFAEDCQRLLDRARTHGPDPEPQRGFHVAAAWSRPRQALLRRILLWREQTARAIDRPRPWLLDDAHALDLAADPPATLEALRSRTAGLRALRGDLRHQLLERLSTPLEEVEMEFSAIRPPLDPAQKREVSALKEGVAKIARELDLPEGLLCARRQLESWVATRRWPRALEGWREALLRPLLGSPPSAA